VLLLQKAFKPFSKKSHFQDIKMSEAFRKIEDNITHSFAKRNKVEVCEGEYQNPKEEIIAIDGNFITIMPESEKNMEPIKFLHSQLKGYFKQTDAIKIRYNIIRNF